MLADCLQGYFLMWEINLNQTVHGRIIYKCVSVYGMFKENLASAFVVFVPFSI